MYVLMRKWRILPLSGLAKKWQDLKTAVKGVVLYNQKITYSSIRDLEISGGTVGGSQWRNGI